MSRVYLVMLVTAMLLGWPAAASPQRYPSFLDGSYHGPYRGRVIDADTRQPLVGAVVVAQWTRDKVYPLLYMNVFYAIRETLTGPDGTFVIEAKDIEERAPQRTYRPDFVIFTPDYGSFPYAQTAPTGFTGGIFEGAGATVELPRLRSREERLKHLHQLNPYRLSEQPFKDIPAFMRAYNAESVELKLQPLPPPRESR